MMVKGIARFVMMDRCSIRRHSFGMSYQKPRDTNVTKKTETDLVVQLGPVRFKNPVFIASGICGYGEEYSPLVRIQDLGGVVTKTITIRPRLGNPPPRSHELPTGALNSIGLENVGLDVDVRDKLPLLADKQVGVIVSIAAEHSDEFAQIAETLTTLDGYHGIELN